MGEVNLARDTKRDRKVAINVLHQEFGKDADKLNRLFRKPRRRNDLD
jgi:hypothetical protein